MTDFLLNETIKNTLYNVHVLTRVCAKDRWIKYFVVLLNNGEFDVNTLSPGKYINKNNNKFDESCMDVLFLKTVYNCFTKTTNIYEIKNINDKNIKNLINRNFLDKLIENGEIYSIYEKNEEETL